MNDIAIAQLEKAAKAAVQEMDRLRAALAEKEKRVSEIEKFVREKFCETCVTPGADGLPADTCSDTCDVKKLLEGR